MENMNKKVKRMARGNARRKLWHRAVAIPAAIVVFVTTYALILPAIAMERDTYCGLEAHQHTAECYTAELACGYEDGAAVQDVQLVTELACGASAHQHTADCYDETGAVICGYADYLVHEHTADCYAADGTLVCPLPQVEAHTHDENCYIDETVNVCGMAESEGHIHTADCYSLVSHPELVCGMAESAGHFHTADCYTTRENTYLACGMAESAGHIHGEGCYVTTVAEDGTETTELVCTEPESMGHTHTEACWATETVTELTCGQAESAGHTHTDACWANVETLELTCGQAESAGHTHTDACYATQKRLVCPKPEVILHTHNDDCYTVTVAEDGTENRELTCTQTVIEEHVHTADCFHTYEQTIERPHEHTDLCYIQTLTCTLPEHEHTEECYAAPETPEVPETPEYICGLQGHTHTELCYDEAGELICGLEEHVHDETCLPVEIADGEPVEMGGEPDGNVQIVEDDTPAFQMPVLACGLAEHEHSTSCMDENMNYVCGLTAHAHTGDCYEIPGLAGVTPELVCDKHEHFHTEACYNENGEIACGLDEHTHGVGCFALPEGVADPDAAPEADEIDENTYWCGFEAHEHTEACLDANGVAVCGLPEHEHTEACLVEPTWYCGYEAHTHGEGCYDETGALVCGLPEHTHSDACKVEPTWYCGKTAHTHDESCYDENGALICGLEEHVHTADCKVQHFTQMAYADGVMVTASYTSEAGLPIDAVLQVTRFTEGEHYEARVNEASEVFHAANPDQLFQPQALLNIGFYLPDGTEVEPAAPVDVTVQLVGEDGLAEGEQYTVIHYGAAGTELLDVAEGEASVNFTAESFSDFLINYDMDPSDGGSTVADGEQNEGEQQVDPSWAPFNPNYILGSSSPFQPIDGYTSISGELPEGTNFNHSKTIDYLGDNQKEDQKDSNNPDTTVDDKSDNEAVTDDLYRLYLDMDGASEPVNLLIILDRSGSMSTGRDAMVATSLFGNNATSNQIAADSLIAQFLAPNATAASDKDKNYVSMVWYAGHRGFTGTEDSTDTTTRQGERANTGPLAASEGGVCFPWASTTGGIGFNYNTDIKGGAISGGQPKGNSTVATNYVAGFAQAHKMLKSAPYADTHKQVVIFISDGVPTLCYDPADVKNAWGNESQLATLTRYGYGTEINSLRDREDCTPYVIARYAKTLGDTYYDKFKANLHEWNLKRIEDSPYYGGVLKCFDLFYNDHKDVNFFVIGIDMTENIGVTGGMFVGKNIKAPGTVYTRNWILDKMAAYYGRNSALTVGSNDQAKLKTYLQQIMFPAGVTITDTLSQYVEMYAEQPDIKVTAISKRDGSEIVLWSCMNKTLSGTGNITNQGTFGTTNIGSTKPQNIIQSVSYSKDSQGKGVVTLTFQPNYCLGSEYTYRISFNVRLTETAYKEYADNMNSNSGTQYSDTGDGDDPATQGKKETTDYGGNQTSSDKPGFYSNDEAHVTYTIDENGTTRQYTLYYDEPVVQAWGTRFKFTKKADSVTGEELKGIPFQLQKKNGDTWEPYDTGNVQSNNKDDNGWYLTGEDGTIDFGYLGEKGEYRLVEKVPEEYENAGKEIVWLTFNVEKGRIINAKPASDSWSDTGVQWKDETGQSVHVNYDFNSVPNNAYGAAGYATVVNSTYKKDLTIVKQDEDGNNLPDAWFQLSKDADNDRITNPDDDWVALKVDELKSYIDTKAGVEINDDGWMKSSDNGLVFKGKLPYGYYRLAEQEAPANYEKLGEDKSVIFYVDEYGIKLEPDDDHYKDFATLDDIAGELTLTIKDDRIEAGWNLKKVDASNENVTLKGAVFSLYGPYEKAEDFKAENPEPPIYKGETDENGQLKGIGGFTSAEGLPGLKSGMYYFLVEDQAPDGFNKLDNPIQLHANQEKAGDKIVLTVTNGSVTQTIEPDEDSDPPMYTVKVDNTTGYELPESGGVGTTVYTLSGLAMLALAGAMFCANRRKSRT